MPNSKPDPTSDPGERPDQDLARRQQAEQALKEAEETLEQRVAERTAALCESEERLRLMVDGTKDCALFMLDPQGHVTTWNEGGRRLKGYESDEVLGRHFSLFYTPEDVAAGKPARELEAAQSEGKYEEEGERVRKDGSRFWASVLISPLRDKQGRLRGFSKVIRDITERKRAEARLTADLAALTRMHALSREPLAAAGLQPLLQEIMDAAVAVMGAERGTLQLLEGDSLRLVAHHGHQQPFLEFFADAENRTSVCGEAMQRGKRVVVPDVEASPLFAGTPSLPVLREAGVRAVQSTPMVSRTGALLGILTTQWGAPHCPDEHDLWRIDLLARQAADLIEQARSEAALRESEARLRLAHQAGKIGAFEWNIQTGANVWTPELEAMYGLARGEFGKTQPAWEQLVHPEDRAAAVGLVNQTFETGEPVEGEWRVVWRDGSVHWLAGRFQAFKDVAGKPLRLSGVNLDITQRKRSEEALRESEQRLKHAQQIADVGSWEWDIQTGGLWWSDQVYRQMGEQAGRFTPTYDGFVQRVHPEDRAAFEAAVQCAVAGTAPYDLEFRIVRPDRAVRVLHSRGEVLPGRDGRPRNMVGVCLDITERKRAEEALSFLAQSGSTTSGEDFFQGLARHLGQSLGMDYVCIDRLEAGSLAARTVAIYFDGKFEDNVSYTLKDTPCGDVVGKTICCFPRDVRHLFPKDAVLQEMLAESYVGVTLWGSRGQPIGLIAVLGRKPLADTRLATSILQVVSVRAAAELERRLAEQEQKTAAEFLRVINQTRSTRDLVQAATVFFQEQTGCQAVGVRLKEGDDYPYYETRGFPRAFVLAENQLCSRDETGRPARDAAGHPILECMCGNIICGRFDPAKPFFTAGGSFWTNGTTELLATSTEADRQARTRNRCNGEGYESVALLPLRFGEQRLGLLQLNDRRKGRFALESIALWERLAGYLAVALAKSRAEDELRASNEELNRFNQAMVGRELRMAEMKEEVNALCVQLGQPPRYGLEADEQARPTE